MSAQGREDMLSREVPALERNGTDQNSWLMIGSVANKPWGGGKGVVRYRLEISRS